MDSFSSLWSKLMDFPEFTPIPTPHNNLNTSSSSSSSSSIIPSPSVIFYHQLRLKCMCFLLIGVFIGVLLTCLLQWWTRRVVKAYKQRSLKARKDHWLPHHPQISPDEPYSWGFHQEMANLVSSQSYTPTLTTL